MLIPNAQQAVIAPEKLRDYLLNAQHRKGASKARILIRCGYASESWQILEADLRSQHLSAEVFRTTQNAYGERFEIRAPLRTPTGRELTVRSIWQIDRGTNVPRLITMYPR